MKGPWWLGNMSWNYRSPEYQTHAVIITKIEPPTISNTSKIAHQRYFTSGQKNFLPPNFLFRLVRQKTLTQATTMRRAETQKQNTRFRNFKPRATMIMSRGLKLRKSKHDINNVVFLARFQATAGFMFFDKSIKRFENIKSFEKTIKMSRLTHPLWIADSIVNQRFIGDG